MARWQCPLSARTIELVLGKAAAKKIVPLFSHTHILLGRDLGRKESWDDVGENWRSEIGWCAWQRWVRESHPTKRAIASWTSNINNSISQYMVYKTTIAMSLARLSSPHGPLPVPGVPCSACAVDPPRCWSPVEVLTPSSSTPSSHTSTPTLRPTTPSFLTPCPAVASSLYIPAPACQYTPGEIAQSHHQINRHSSTSSWIEHPMNTIVEYPQTDKREDKTVAHFFPVDPHNFVHPRSSFQYSLGDAHSGRKGVWCYLLRNTSGKPIWYNIYKASCKFLMLFLSRHANYHLE